MNSCAIFASWNKSALLPVIFRRRFDDFNVAFAMSSFPIGGTSGDGGGEWGDNNSADMILFYVFNQSL